jgi:hypothetical protein
MNWDDDPARDPRVPRRPGWGCLAALIVSTVGLIVVVVLVAHWLGGIEVPKIR